QALHHLVEGGGGLGVASDVDVRDDGDAVSIHGLFCLLARTVYGGPAPFHAAPLRTRTSRAPRRAWRDHIPEGGRTHARTGARALHRGHARAPPPAAQPSRQR